MENIRIFEDNVGIFVVLFVLGFALGYIVPLLLRGLKKGKNNSDIAISIPISPETKKQDLELVYDAMNRAITKALYHFAMRDFKFSDKSPVQLYSSGNYRDLITYLVRDDIFFEETEEDGLTRRVSFFSYFFQKVYLFYISETSKNVKDLLFKYYSGYSIDNYDDPKAKPSVIPFLVEYTKNYVYARYDDNQNAEAYFLGRLNEESVETSVFEKWMKEYDSECIRKICLNIYHINDLTEKNKKLSSETIKVSNKENKKEKKNEFSIDFNEQSK